ncbi:MAG TPA: hypothetical protein PLI18_16665 [Pirellulaceae bacterium]|nr:hypothetical protein [Pirellulaceae bacterium]
MSFQPSHNPYSSPMNAPTYAGGPQAARGKLMPVGIALLVVGIFGVLFGTGYFILTLIGLQMNPELEAQRQAMGEEEKVGFYIGYYGMLAWLAFQPVGSLIVSLGSISFLRQKGRGLAMFTAILAVIPCCTSPLCGLGLPFGIWALVVLADPNVKAQMR